MNYKIIKFNTSYGSSNIGDYIINESADKELAYLFDENFVINYPTHTPVIHFYQSLNNNLLIKNCNNAKYKFLCGTNILAKNMIRLWPNWNVNIFGRKPYRGTILVGCGMAGNFKKTNLYTKFLYKSILSKDYIHSTRDEKTKRFLEGMGYRAINTGCVTMWQLTSSHCSQIPHSKSDSVVFTLTDYCRDYDRDGKMLEVLRKNYKNIYYWVQGSNDYEYLKDISEDISDITLLYGLDSYRKVLKETKIDYVGTRLHAGIFAMQNKKRSIIIMVDNRAKDIKETYGLPAIAREDIDKLDCFINSSFATSIDIDEEKITEWKAQFRP